MRRLWDIGGWHLFVDQGSSSQFGQPAAATPVLAWLPAHFRNRFANDFDFFNLSEHLAFTGHPEIPVLWALAANTNPATITSRLARTILVVDPSVVTSRERAALMSSLAAAPSRLNVLLLNDGSELARAVDAQRGNFADFVALSVNRESLSAADLGAISRRILQWQAKEDSPTATARQLWLINSSYFPEWKTENGESVWLTGQGRMAAVDTVSPALRWSDSKWNFAPVICCLAGLGLALIRVAGHKYLTRSIRIRPALKRSGAEY